MLRFLVNLLSGHKYHKPKLLELIPYPCFCRQYGDFINYCLICNNSGWIQERKIFSTLPEQTSPLREG